MLIARKASVQGLEYGAAKNGKARMKMSGRKENGNPHLNGVNNAYPSNQHPTYSLFARDAAPSKGLELCLFKMKSSVTQS